MDFDEAVSFLAKRLPESPSVFIAYTSALGKFPISLESPMQFSCEEIPRFPSKKQGIPSLHLVYGKVLGVHILVLQGRYHYFDGYTNEEICFPVRVAKSLGCKKMMVINASGSVKEEFNLGDLMVVHSHVDLNVLGQDTRRILKEGKKEIDENVKMYDKDFGREVRRMAIKEGMDKYVKPGIYGMIEDSIPKSYSQIMNWKTIGIDAVGTSLVPEVQAAAKLDMEVFAISLLTDKGILDYSEHPDPLLEDIFKALETKKPFLKKLILRFIELSRDCR